MEERSGKSGDEDGSETNCFFYIFGLKEEKWERDKETQKESSKNGVKVGAMESEISRRTEVAARRVDVGDGSGDENGECRGARQARKSGALERVRSEGVSERVHEGVISQKEVRRQQALPGETDQKTTASNS
jgi:hypothetical protein